MNLYDILMSASIKTLLTLNSLFKACKNLTLYNFITKRSSIQHSCNHMKSLIAFSWLHDNVLNILKENFYHVLLKALHGGIILFRLCFKVKIFMHFRECSVMKYWPCIYYFFKSGDNVIRSYVKKFIHEPFMCNLCSNIKHQTFAKTNP